VTIDPVARPAQDLGEVIVGWQTLKSTERRPYRERLKSAAVTDCCSEPKMYQCGCGRREQIWAARVSSIGTCFPIRYAVLLDE